MRSISSRFSSFVEDVDSSLIRLRRRTFLLTAVAVCANVAVAQTPPTITTQPTSQTAQVGTTVTVTLPPIAATIEPDRTVFLQITNLSPLDFCMLQIATNLIAPIRWLPIITNQVDSLGIWSYFDTNTLADPTRFYRIQLLRP